MSTNNSNNKNHMDEYWAADLPIFNGGVAIKQRSTKVTEESERSRREYWSNYWRKKNHVGAGCHSW